MNALVILLIPLVAAALVCIPLPRHWAMGVTVAASVATLVATGQLAWQIASGKVFVSTIHAGMLQWIAIDGLSALILLLISFVATTASIFSIGYLGHKNLSSGRLRLFYANYNLFVFSMLAVPMVAEPTLVWIMVELTTLCSALLVSYDNTRGALEAAWKYVLLSLMGAGLALFGFLVLFAAMQAAGGGSYTWHGLLAVAPHMPPALLQTAFVLILIGLGTKVGLVPMHTWLPDAHSQAPSPVCALLSGVETTVILYVILRMFPVMQAAPHSHAASWAMILGLISVGAAAFLLLQVRDYKRMFAFSTVEHMGIILTAVGFGTAAGNYGAMQQIVAHSVTKSFCFFAAGSTLMAVSSREIATIRRLIHRSPGAGIAMILGGLGIAGAPPLAVFLSEFSILRTGLMQGRYVATGLLAAFIVIAFFGVMLHANRIVFGEHENGQATDLTAVPDADGEHGVQFRLPFSCKLALFLAAVPMILFGLYIPTPLHELLALAGGALTP